VFYAPFLFAEEACKGLAHRHYVQPMMAVRGTHPTKGLLNFTFRKAVETKGSFPNKEAAFKVLYLALRNVEKRWTMLITNWKSALNFSTILFEGRMPSRFI
jgi:transposase-like protein